MRNWMAAVLIALIFATAAAAKEQAVLYKTVEAKHFTRSEGVELSPAFGDYLYAELRSELTKTKVFGQVVGEGEAVDDADAPNSIVVEGMITEYKKGNKALDALVGFGAGMRDLKINVNVTRRSDHQDLGALKSHVKISPRWNEEVMAKAAARQIANEIKKELKDKEKGK